MRLNLLNNRDFRSDLLGKDIIQRNTIPILLELILMIILSTKEINRRQALKLLEGFLVNFIISNRNKLIL